MKNQKKDSESTTKKTKRVVRQLTDSEIGFVTAVLSDKPHLSDADIAQQMQSQGYGTDLTKKDLRNKVRYARIKILKEKPSERIRMQEHQDGSITVHRHTTGMKDDFAEKFLDEQLLAEMNLDPSKFTLSSYGESVWTMGNGEEGHSTRKKFVRMNPKEMNADPLILASTRRKLMEIYGNNVANMNADIQKFGNVEELISNAYGAFYGKTEIKTVEDAKYSLVIPLTDLHIGEGSAQKMVKSYKKTFEETIIPQIKEKYFSSNVSMVRTIDIACLGDLIHCDNGAGTTTAGTALHPKSNVYTSFDYCVDFIDWLVTTLRETFKMPIRIIYVYGNHDNNMGFGIMRTLNALFKKVQGIELIINEKLIPVATEEGDEAETTTVAPWYAEAELNPEYMWIKYGNVGITYTHGKFMKKNAKDIPEVANPYARKMVDFNVVIYGHLHHISEGTACVNQHNYGISTPNFVRDSFGKSLGCVTDSEFYLFEVNHSTNRVNYTQIPSVSYDYKKPNMSKEIF